MEIVKETTAGTDPGSGYKVVPIDSETFEPKPNFTGVVRSAKSLATAGHGYGIPITGDFSLRGPTAADLTHFLHGFTLEYGFAADTGFGGAQVGINKHTFTINDDAPDKSGAIRTKTVRVNYDFNRVAYSGVWFNSMSLSQRLGEPLMVTFGGIGSAAPVRGSVTDATPTVDKGFGAYDPSIPSWDMESPVGTTIKANLKGFDLRIERSYNSGLFLGDSLYCSRSQRASETRITGTILTDKNTSVLIDDLLARTERALFFGWAENIVAGTDRERLQILLNGIIKTGGIPHMGPQRTPPGYEGSFTFEVYEITSPGLRIEVYSNEATL